MKIIIEESDGTNDIEIYIKCNRMTDNLEFIISTLRLYDNVFVGKEDNVNHMIKATDIFYFETTDNKIFIYTKDKVYETVLKIYQIEEKLQNTSFVRISKSSIVNLRKIKSIQNAGNGKLMAELANNEKIMISRMYMTDVKKKLGL